MKPTRLLIVLLLAACTVTVSFAGKPPDKKIPTIEKCFIVEQSIESAIIVVPEIPEMNIQIVTDIGQQFLPYMENMKVVKGEVAILPTDGDIVINNVYNGDSKATTRPPGQLIDRSDYVKDLSV